MSTSWEQAIQEERDAWEAFKHHTAELARAAATQTIWSMGDVDGGSARMVMDSEFWERGIDIFGWHQPVPARTPLTEKQKQAIYERDGRLCRWCRATDRLTIDHIHPVRWGGTNDPGNLQVLCQPCNSWKSDRTEQSS